MRRFDLDIIKNKPEKKEDMYLFKDDVGNVVLSIQENKLEQILIQYQEELNYLSSALELLKKV